MARSFQQAEPGSSEPEVFTNHGKGDQEEKPATRAPLQKKLLRVPFKVSRLMEFCTKRELENQTGHSSWHWPSVMLKECIDNGMDNCEEHGIPPTISITVTPDTISFEDNGSGMSGEIVDGVIDYGIRISSREAYVSPTRGAQGNALKTILAMGYVLDECRGDDAAGRTIIEARGVAHHIAFTVDHIRQQPKIAHTTKSSRVKQGTRVTITLPRVRYGSNNTINLLEYCKNDLIRIAGDYLWLNPHLSLRLVWNGETVVDGKAFNSKWTKWTPSRPTSAHWYDAGRLQRYMAAHIAHRDGVTVREFVSEFYGMSGSAKQKSVLFETGASHMRIARGSKFHQVFGDEHLAGKVHFHLVGPWRVVVTARHFSQVRQHYGFDVGARRHLPNGIGSHMGLGRLSHDAGLLGGGHYLPLSVINQLLLAVLDRIDFRDQQIGPFGEFRDLVAGAGIAGKNHYAIGRIKAIGVGFVLADGRAGLMEFEIIPVAHRFRVRLNDLTGGPGGALLNSRVNLNSG
jgi:hypothetical protein